MINILPSEQKAEELKPYLNGLMLILGIIVSIIGLVGLIGYAFNISYLADAYLQTDGTVVSIISALGTFFLGIAVISILHYFPFQKKSYLTLFIQYISLGISAAAGIILIITCFLEINFDILIKHFPHIPAPIFTTVGWGLFLSSLALYLILTRPRSQGAIIYGSNVFALVVLKFGLFALTGHLMNIPVLYSFDLASPVAVALILVGVSILFGTVPLKGLFLPLLSNVRRNQLLAFSAILLSTAVTLDTLFTIDQFRQHFSISGINVAGVILGLDDIYVLAETTGITFSVLIHVISMRAAQFLDESMFFAEQQTRGFEAEKSISRIFKSIDCSMDLGDIFKIIVNELGGVLGADSCFICRLDEDTRELILPAREYRYSQTVPSAIEDSISKGIPPIPHWLIDMMCIEDRPFEFSLREPSLSVNVESYLQKVQAQSAIGQILICKGKCLAVLFVHSIRSRFWTQFEKDFIHVVANQAAMAICQAESYNRLLTTEESYRRLIEGVKDYAIFMLDPEGNIISWNVGAERIYGYKAEEIIGRHFSRFFPSEDIWKVKGKHLLEQTAETGRFEYEDMQVRKDGSKFWAHITDTALYNDKGEFIGFSKIVRDVTERKHAEDALKQNETKLRRIVDSNLIGILFTDIYGNIFSANDAFLNMVGYGQEDILSGNLNWKKITPAEYVDKNNYAVNEIKTKGSLTPFEKQYIRKDGSRVDVLIGAAAFAEDPLENVVAFVLDISKRKEYEREQHRIYQREHLIRQITEAINQSFDIDSILNFAVEAVGRYFVADRCIVYRYVKIGDRLVLKISAQYCRSEDIAPVRSEDIPFVSIPILPPEEIERKEPLLINITKSEEYIEGGRLFMNHYHAEFTADFEEQLREYVNKHSLEAELVFEIYYRGNTYGLVSLQMSTSERKWQQEETTLLQDIAAHLGIAFYQVQLFQEEQRARREAEEATQKKSQFLANMSHELRTPLNSVIGYADMLDKNYAGELSVKQKQYVSNIIVSGHHLLDMVNDVLDLSKVTSGEIQLSPQWVDIPSVIADVKVIMEQFAKDKKVHLAFHIQPDVDGLEADPQRLKQIFLNLISNAVKFNNEGGEVNALVFKSEDKEWVICEIHDTGIGIPKDKMSKLFTEFYQVDPTTTRKHEGTGLGLSLTRRLVELHGGTIWAESEEGKGSVFSFKLPVRRR